MTRNHLTNPAARDWYHPPPVDPHPKFMILPVTTGRPVARIPAVNREAAIARLSHCDFVELASADCQALGVPCVADKLIDVTIAESEADPPASLVTSVFSPDVRFNDSTLQRASSVVSPAMA